MQLEEMKSEQNKLSNHHRLGLRASGKHFLLSLAVMEYWGTEHSPDTGLTLGGGGSSEMMLKLKNRLFSELLQGTARPPPYKVVLERGLGKTKVV